MVVVVAVDLFVLDELCRTDVLVPVEGGPQNHALLDLGLFFLLVDCFETGVGEVVLLPLGKNDELQEEPKEVDLSLLRLADPGDGLDFFEVQECIDADVVIFLIDGIECEFPYGLGCGEGEKGGV